ncbi:uncharacterized protein [Rutidosis leptorrhynchoides]|uniref:uncharacterized protein n=1 Tax=Rutidosis leptorrhynchoides TaxID=125765 RepID=UPI003A99B357
MKSGANGNKSDSFCQFHKDYGHTTDECRQGPNKYNGGRRDNRRKGKKQDNNNNKNNKERTPPNELDMPQGGGVVHMIFGEEFRMSNKKKKDKVREVMSVGIPQKKRKVSTKIITIGFSDDDLENLLYPHSDPLVVIMSISGTDVWRVLVDDGSSVDILYYHAYRIMGFADKHLAPSHGPIYAVN